MTLEQQEKYSSFAIRFERDDEAGVWIALRGLLIRIATALPDFMG